MQTFGDRQIRHRLTFVTLVCLLFLLTFTFATTSARWCGQFVLCISLNIPPDADRDSFRYVECWTEAKALWLCREDTEVDAGFTSPFRSDGNADYVMVSCGGTSNAFGFFDSHHHPAFLVVQYRSDTAGASSSWNRVAVPIPAGRGDRSLTLDLT